ncbi:unnamed protein product [Cylicostephanus goldi]|uniref:Uncharacterized protein n=1 Tax=Cylicostephanus goldi TaxID=71465 RepID=A0A3P7QQP5_CYLGO|nr:unnamed protein product [Cylicostephanus goldi]
MEAFESEVIAAFNDSPLPALRTSHVSDLAANAPSIASPGAGFGITVKATDTPPTLNPEETVTSETLERETNSSELDSIWSDGDEAHFDSQGTSDSNQVPGTSFNPMRKPQVIGALANANDDPYKPKMECPTCPLPA